MDNTTIKCPWGMWNMETGMWQHNPNLKMSEEEQFNDNIKNGFLCSCSKMPSMCNCKGNTKYVQLYLTTEN